MNPAAGHNLPPVPIDDPHMRIANHEDLLPTDRTEIIERMMDSPDDFAAWEAELRTLDATPAPTPEDVRNKERLAGLFDQPPFAETAEKAAEVPPANERVRSDETRDVLKALGDLAETKPQSADDVDERDPNYQKIRSAMAGMGMTDADLVKANYLANHGANGPQMQKWLGRKKAIMAQASQILADHPDQSMFFLNYSRTYADNAAAYHNAPAGGTSTWDKESNTVVDHQTQHRRIQNDPHIPDSSLEAAAVRVDLRDTTTQYQEMRGRHAQSVELSNNFDELLGELELDHDDGAAEVADFVQQYEASEGRNIDEAVKELNEGENFRAYLEAGPDPEERAKAEQPIWRDIQHTAQAASQLKTLLANMRTRGMSPAHSHYREMYAKFTEVQRAHVSSWQRLQTVRQARAVERNPLGTPDFQGRRAVIVASDQQKGVYVMTGRGNPITVVYPDTSMRSIQFDPTTGAAIVGDRYKLDGSEWKEPEPVELTYEPVAAATTTTGLVGRVAMLRSGAGRNHERTDTRDFNTLVAAYAEAQFQVHMHPANYDALRQSYDITRLLEQRTGEHIATLEAVDPADRTPEQQNSLNTLLQSRGVLQARAKYLEHGSKDNLSTMNPDASIDFRGTMYDEDRPRDWHVALTGDAIKQYAGGVQQAYHANGTRV